MATFRTYLVAYILAFWETQFFCIVCNNEQDKTPDDRRRSFMFHSQMCNIVISSPSKSTIGAQHTVFKWFKSTAQEWSPSGEPHSVTTSMTSLGATLSVCVWHSYTIVRWHTHYLYYKTSQTAVPSTCLQCYLAQSLPGSLIPILSVCVNSKITGHAWTHICFGFKRVISFCTQAIGSFCQLSALLGVLWQTRKTKPMRIKDKAEKKKKMDTHKQFFLMTRSKCQLFQLCFSGQCRFYLSNHNSNLNRSVWLCSPLSGLTN